MKVKKKDLLLKLEKMQSQLNELNEKIANLEPKSLEFNQNVLQLPLFDLNQSISKCSQCNNDLNKLSSCMSVNCPYSYKVTCHA